MVHDSVAPRLKDTQRQEYRVRGLTHLGLDASMAERYSAIAVPIQHQTDMAASSGGVSPTDVATERESSPRRTW